MRESGAREDEAGRVPAVCVYALATRDGDLITVRARPHACVLWQIRWRSQRVSVSIYTLR